MRAVVRLDENAQAWRCLVRHPPQGTRLAVDRLVSVDIRSHMKQIMNITRDHTHRLLRMGPSTAGVAVASIFFDGGFASCPSSQTGHVDRRDGRHLDSFLERHVLGRRSRTEPTPPTAAKASGSQACRSYVYLNASGCDANGCLDNIQSDLTNGAGATINFACKNTGGACTGIQTYAGGGNGKPLCIGFDGLPNSQLVVKCVDGSGTYSPLNCKISGAGLTYAAQSAVVVFGATATNCLDEGNATSYVKFSGFRIEDIPAANSPSAHSHALEQSRTTSRSPIAGSTAARRRTAISCSMTREHQLHDLRQQRRHQLLAQRLVRLHRVPAAELEHRGRRQPFWTPPRFPRSRTKEAPAATSIATRCRAPTAP